MNLSQKQEVDYLFNDIWTLRDLFGLNTEGPFGLVLIYLFLPAGLFGWLVEKILIKIMVNNKQV